MKKFKLLRRDRAASSIPEDVDTVYDSIGWDYGCSNDDTRWTGIEHISVTLNEAGEYPFFTIPKCDLEEIHDKP